MASEDFEVEEWDADFLDQLVQAEEIALSSRATQAPLPPQLPPPPHTAAQYEISYSPPRELSQRVPDTNPKSVKFDSFIAAPPIPRVTHNPKEQEIDTLKVRLIDSVRLRVFFTSVLDCILRDDKFCLH